MHIRTSHLKLVALISLLVATAALLAACGGTGTGLRIVTGTTLIANAVRDVAGDRVSVTNIIPAGTCPGQYDVKPSDVEAAARGQLLLMHDYQRTHKDVSDIIAAANNPGLAVKAIEIKGNWLVPAMQAEAIGKVAAELAAADPSNASYYIQRAADRQAAVIAKGDDIKAGLGRTGFQGKKVIANDKQAGFLQWLGFEVVGVYGRAEEFTPAGVADLVSRAKAAGVSLVVDNLQSTPDGGRQMAADIGVQQVTISNFPGGFPSTETWEKTVEDNISRLTGALSRKV